ncbi:beta-lactamase/transpeptidase-like protein [Thozetella sp. PMI_491]|nr:beta-lactamase/transpeptidase-like protein [Thozetella sp. PMI_491]
MEALDRILREHVAQGDDTKDKLFGAAFVVVDKDGIVYQGAFGRTAEALDAPKFRIDSFTWLASLTKIVTATAVMQLVERGQVNLDDDVRPLVPELARMQVLKGFDQDEKPILVNNPNPITLRQLLTHTVGLGYDLADPDLTKWSRAIGRTVTNLEFRLEGWNTPLKFPSGEGWFYGSAFDWAAQVLEKVTGQGLEQYMKEHVFDPLGMHDTTFHSRALADSVKNRTVLCSYRDEQTGKLSNGPPPVPVEPPIESGGAGLWSTAVDHAKVLSGLLRAAPAVHGAGSVLSKETVDEMLRPQLNDVQRQMLVSITDAHRLSLASAFPPGTPLDHGISGLINTADVPGKRRKGSMTWLGMASAHWWIDRESGIAATLLLSVQPHPDLVVNRLYDELERSVYADLLPSLAK